MTDHWDPAGMSCRRSPLGDVDKFSTTYTSHTLSSAYHSSDVCLLFSLSFCSLERIFSQCLFSLSELVLALFLEVSERKDYRGQDHCQVNHQPLGQSVPWPQVVLKVADSRLPGHQSVETYFGKETRVVRYRQPTTSLRA